jgi:uncharacterized Zn finger protein
MSNERHNEDSWKLSLEAVLLYGRHKSGKKDEEGRAREIRTTRPRYRQTSKQFLL